MFGDAVGGRERRLTQHRHTPHTQLRSLSFRFFLLFLRPLLSPAILLLLSLTLSLVGWTRYSILGGGAAARLRCIGMGRGVQHMCWFRLGTGHRPFNKVLAASWPKPTRVR